MSPITEQAAMALVALSDLKHRLQMVNRMAGSNDNLDMLIFDLEKVKIEVLAIAKANREVPAEVR